MKKDDYDALFIEIINEVKETRDSGQKEYAHTEDNVFANFDRTSKQLGTSRDKVLMTFLMKHIDGIVAYVNGHKSQREDITGRIKDSIVYLTLYWAMVVDSKKENTLSNTFNQNFKSIFNPDSGEVKYTGEVGV